MLSYETTAVILLLNIAVSIPGIYEWHFTDSGKEREEVIENYNGAVKKWKTENLEGWESVQSIAVYDWSETGSDQHITLLPESTDEKTEKGEGTNHYSPLRYVSSSNTVSLNLTIAPEWAIVVSKLTFTTASQSIHRPFLNIPLTQLVVHNTSNWKQCSHSLKGSVHGKQCMTYNIVNYICVLFEEREQPGGAGLRWVASTDCGVSYIPVKVNRFDGTPSSVSLPSTLTVVTRHIMDPYIVAHRVTNGTLKFGRSASDRQTIIKLSATFSLVTFVIFICLNGYLYYYSDELSTKIKLPPQESILIDEPLHRHGNRRRATRQQYETSYRNVIFHPFATIMPVTELLVFTEKLSAVCGSYTVSGEKYNDEFVWVGSGDKRLFSSRNRRWYIGNTSTMVQDSGWIRSGEHNGKSPWESVNWETFEKVGRPWQIDSGIQVTPSDDNNPRDTSVTASEEVSMIMRTASKPQTNTNNPNMSSRPIIKATTKPLPKPVDQTTADAEISRLRSELSTQKRANDALSAQLSLLAENSSETESLLTKLKNQLLQCDQLRVADSSELEMLRNENINFQNELFSKDSIIERQEQELRHLTTKYSSLSESSLQDDLHHKLRSWAAGVLSDS